MTIVIAKQFDDRIVVMSDSRITDTNAAKPNLLPGRLKSVVLNEKMTVAYAGLATQALDVIRALWKATSQSITVADAEEFLRLATASYQGEIDFILASHSPTARLVKVAEGKIYEGAEAYWIGDSVAANSIYKLKEADTLSVGGEWWCKEEMALRRAFIDYIREHYQGEVGGVAIDCLASPYGHCYNTHAGSFSWDTILLGQVDQEEQEKMNKTGIYHYTYNVIPASQRGVPVIGLFLEQGGFGFVYSPLASDEPRKLFPITLDGVLKEVDAEAARIISS